MIGHNSDYLQISRFMFALSISGYYRMALRQHYKFLLQITELDRHIMAGLFLLATSSRI